MLALKVLKFEEGRVSVKDRTIVFMPADVLLQMQQELEKKLGREGAESHMFEMGKYQTVTGSIRYFMEKKELSKIFKRVPNTGDPAIEMGREILKFSGWGDTTIQSISREGGEIVLKTEKSPLAEEFIKIRGKSRQPVCHYLRGLLIGVIESVYEGEFVSVERSCKATGLSEHCIFEFRRKH